MEPDETPELRMKKWEELYALTKEQMSKLEERFDAVEEKSTRHFGLLAVLLGAVGIGLEKLVLVINGTCSLMGSLFVILYVVLAIAILAAMVMYLLSMNYNKLKDLPMR